MAGMERGLTMPDMRRMQLGQVVEFIKDYNERQKDAEKKADRQAKAKHYTLGTQDQIDAYLSS